jgi:hypothetical protein
MQIHLRNPPRDLGGYELRALVNGLLAPPLPAGSGERILVGGCVRLHTSGSDLLFQFLENWAMKPPPLLSSMVRDSNRLPTLPTLGTTAMCLANSIRTDAGSSLSSRIISAISSSWRRNESGTWIVLADGPLRMARNHVSPLRRANAASSPISDTGRTIV